MSDQDVEGGMGKPIFIRETEDHYIVPEEVFQYLPEPWRGQVEKVLEDGHTVLRSVDKELNNLTRLVNSFPTLVSLKHIAKRLSQYEFAADMDTILDLDMLTTAFVVTYARLEDGGKGSGFSRDALPTHLREAHDHILEIRNKRFAHNAGHHSTQNALRVNFVEDHFAIEFDLTLGYHIGGASEWQEIVPILDALFYDRMDKIFAKLREKTGREWRMPEGPQPG